MIFTQSSREAEAFLEWLPSKQVDTGIDSERLVSIMRSKSSVQDTDVFLAPC